MGTRCLGRIRLGRTVCEDGGVTSENFSQPTTTMARSSEPADHRWEEGEELGGKVSEDMKCMLSEYE